MQRTSHEVTRQLSRTNQEPMEVMCMALRYADFGAYDGGNELKYCGQLSHSSLLRPISGCQDDAEDDLELQYVTIIYLCHLHKNSCTTLCLQEPTQSTCHQLDSVVSIVLPTPCKRLGENFGMILFWGAPMSRR